MSIREKIRTVTSLLSAGAVFGCSSVHGVDILKALKISVDRRKKIFKDKIFVPDRYTVNLSDLDAADLKPFLKAIRTELRDEMQKYIKDKDFQIKAPKIRIKIKARRTLPPGEIEIVGHFSSDENWENHAKDHLVQLRIHPGSPQEAIVELEDGTHVLGRGCSVDVVPSNDDLLISKTHCKIDVSRDGVFVHDLKSTNGTFVNQQMINNTCRLTCGNHIRMGNTEIEVCL